jgi:1-deoxy-D-xylulose-5-phosphate reductoisomerase
MNAKRLIILGSTGSIGQSTLKVVRHHHPQFRVMALAAHSNIERLEQQTWEFHPKLVAVYDEQKARVLAQRIPHIKVVSGFEGLEEVARFVDADICVSALSGTIGICPTLRAIQAGHTIALANKEVLVSAGELIMRTARQYGVKIIPIDSEQSALFQCLAGNNVQEVDRLILTASGGPFFRRQKDFSRITLAEALQHPTWHMGKKNTIDSSTLMNKGLEVIEAHWLFNIPLDNIDVVVHPQSLVHSFVEFIDGSLLAQIAEHDMILPIQYALSYPTRMQRMMKRFDFKTFSTFEFYEPNVEVFACLRLAYEAAREGGSLPCFMNAVNEVLVKRFLEGQITWIDISRKLESLMRSHRVHNNLGLEEILFIDQRAREEALEV